RGAQPPRHQHLRSLHRRRLSGAGSVRTWPAAHAGIDHRAGHFAILAADPDRAAPMSEQRIDIEARVPHAGAMVLINEVVSHDETRITCRANTGALIDHPLGRKGRLPASALAEYGA